MNKETQNKAVYTYLSYFSIPRYSLYLYNIGRKIYKTALPLKSEIFISDEPIPPAEAPNLEFMPIKPGTTWAKELYKCAWFRFSAEGDLSGKFEDPENYAVIIDTGSEGLVYDGVEPVLGLTNILGIGEIFQPVRGKKIVPLNYVLKDGKIDFLVDAGFNGLFGRKVFNGVFKRAEVCSLNSELLEYYYDFLTVYKLAVVKRDNERAEIKRDLNKAMSLSSGLSPESIENARAVLKKYFTGNNDDFDVTAVGHAHLDLAWLWPVRETKRKAERTLTNALHNIKKYPDYVFGVSQPQIFEWIKPSLFQRVKEAVRAGRIEPQGAMWVEPDTNLPSGESLIRQCYYGKGFWKREFGIDMDYLWVPDVFGYSASLPRILKGSGVDKMVTIKINWNDFNHFPHHSFNWEGIGGEQILVHMPPEGDYNSSACPYALNSIKEGYHQKDVSQNALMVFGVGDGGGGPGELHLKFLSRERVMPGLPKVDFGSAKSFFNKLEKDKDAFPSYKGELYLERHQGTYTSQGKTKLNNRRAEQALHELEFILAAAYVKGYPYPHAKLDELWKEVLLYQFHDILPGSSVNRVYKETAAAYERIQSDIKELKEAACKFLGEGELNALNATSFTQNGYIKSENGWKAYQLPPYSALPLKDAAPANELKCGEDFIENEYLRVTFDAAGDIQNILDKKENRLVAKKSLGGLRIYSDKKKRPYDAWDIRIEYADKTPKSLKLESVKSSVDGMSVKRVQKLAFNKSSAVQTIELMAGEPMLRVSCAVDWHENHKMLRADFYPAAYSSKALFDIQMGHFERSTKTDNRIEWAQFEVSAHKWADVYCTKQGYGLALLNDCKYGYRAKNGLISLNLLRSPTYPDKKCDRGRHNFTFALYPHKKPALESELVPLGYRLNNPVKLVNVPKIEEFVKTTNPAVVIENVMVTPDGLVAVRLYEGRNAQAECALVPAFEFKEAFESNLIYENRKPADIAELSFKPYEIKTILLKI
ncbi:MAG: alpha-mannosidase [Christensenellales bacterium]|jgi:alpha-mannosidase